MSLPSILLGGIFGHGQAQVQHSLRSSTEKGKTCWRQNASMRTPMLATKVMMEVKAATSRRNSVISSLLFRYVFILFPSCSSVNKRTNEERKIFAHAECPIRPIPPMGYRYPLPVGRGAESCLVSFGISDTSQRPVRHFYPSVRPLCLEGSTGPLTIAVPGVGLLAKTNRADNGR